MYERNVSLKNAFEALQQESSANGNADMSLEEINSIIAEVRNEYRGNK